MEAKPICVIYFPDSYHSGMSRSWIYEYMRHLNGEQTDGSDGIKWEDRKDYWSQYYWFCFYKEDILSPELVVHNAKDINPIEIEELKSIINKEIQNIKQ